jgi:hypothetical protein
MLDEAEELDFSDVVSWNSSGVSFKVHKRTEFSRKIMTTYFKQTKYKSFLRQLNLYGFVRTHHGCHKASYSHKHFLRRDVPALYLLHRHKVAISKQKPAPIREDSYSNSLSTPGFEDMQGTSSIMDSEAPIDVSVCLDKNAESIDDTSALIAAPVFNDASLSEFRLLTDCFDLDDINIGFDAGNTLSDISNDPRFGQSIMTTPSMNNEDHKLSLERNYSVSDAIDVQEKQVEIEVCGRRQTEHSFPWKLHDMLEAAEQSTKFSNIVSWEPGGISFKVHKREEFVTKIMPLYFDQTKYESFRRQLNLYSFLRGGSFDIHYHASFVKGNRSLCKEVKRTVQRGRT